MSTFPVRRLGSSGVDTDTHPADIENVGTFTGAVNVRFSNGRVSRAPVAKTIAALPHEPGHALLIPAGTLGVDQVITIASDFSSIYRLDYNLLDSTFTNLTPAGHEGVDGPAVITNCHLGGISYLNRETHVPLYKSIATEAYAKLPNWSDGDRCQALRSYKDQLIALGVTKAGQLYPTMVKWSDFVSFNLPPQSWDPTSTTNSAGENIVNEMQHAIVDGLTLGDSFILYCLASVWTMDYIGGDLIYSFRKLFDEIGVINPNCVVQVGGLHYVFDRNDIYVHDGVAPRSITDGKVKTFIFDALDFSRSNLCFVSHDAKLTEIRFAYPSSDKLVGFPNPVDGCNRQAVYNYSNGTWTFYDAPNITGHCKGALISGDTWETDQEVTFEATGGTWSTSEGDLDRHVLVVGRSNQLQGLTAPRLYGIDLLTGGRLKQTPEPECLKPAFLERIGIDLDAEGKNLTQYMHLQHIWPQVSANRPADMYWQFGSNDFQDREPAWSPEQSFDPATEFKLDINEAGKYLGFRFGLRGTGDFQLSGFDTQLVIRGRR